MIQGSDLASPGPNPGTTIYHSRHWQRKLLHKSSKMSSYCHVITTQLLIINMRAPGCVQARARVRGGLIWRKGVFVNGPSVQEWRPRFTRCN